MKQVYRTFLEKTGRTSLPKRSSKFLPVILHPVICSELNLHFETTSWGISLT